MTRDRYDWSAGKAAAPAKFRFTVAAVSKLHHNRTTGRKARALATRLGSYAVVACFAVVQVAGPVWASSTLPQNPSIVAGSASVSQPAAASLRVDQASDRVVIDWESFSIGSDASVRFDQPTGRSIAVNRVTGGSLSEIFGALQANGQIVLLNPNGVLFGAGAQIDVGGLIASTGNLDVQSFMAGSDTLTLNDFGPGAIVNQGNITVEQGGLVAFVAPTLRNDGAIIARLGRVALASGAETATVDLWGDGLVSFAVAPAQRDLFLAQTGSIEAEGGVVALTVAAAEQIVESVINVEGRVSVTSVTQEAGRILLQGGAGSDVTVAGTLDARGTTGGAIDVTGEAVVLTETARLDASGLSDGGSSDGGAIRVGGDLKGQGTFPRAAHTQVAAGASIAADGADAGDGGRVIVWADETTRMDGAISARGGANGGNGGFVETSAAGQLGVTGSVDVTASTGQAGQWLLDPRDVRIVAGTGPVYSGTPDGSGAFFVSADSLTTALDGGANVTVTTAATDTSGSSEGNITVETAVQWVGIGDLSLVADNDIVVDSSGRIVSLGGGSIFLTAGDDIRVRSRVQTANAGGVAGDIVMQAGGDVAVRAADGRAQNVAVEVTSTSTSTTAI